MSARDIVGGLAEAAVWAARKPFETTAQAVGLAKGVVTTGAAAAEGIAQHAAGRIRRYQAGPVPVPEPEVAEESQPDDVAEPEQGDDERTTETRDAEAHASAPATLAVRTTAKKAAPKKAAAKKSTPRKRTAPQDQPGDDGPQVVLREPAPPELPPVDIVGQVLAAEAEQEPAAGRAGEPRGASRDEEHGDASLQRAELDEIAEETAEALPGGDVDVETPVGTTGAGVGFNPDTAEADLQQPQTQPLVDPALTKTVKSAQRTGKKASTKTPKG